jgi:phosphonate transport system ATP-binding protein
MLTLEGLSKTYKTGDAALSDVTLNVPKGQIMGLIGPSGAGKSTLIRCINRLVEPTSGKVMLGEVNLVGLSKADLRRQRRRIGMIFQEYALVERLTVMENVLSGRLGYVPFWRSFLRKYPASDIQRAYQLLDRVGLMDKADNRADALSGGQRQRVGIARALAQDPELLLVDEPTASLDPKTSRQIMRLLTEICAERGLPAIVNIHDVPLAQQFMQRIVGLRAGRVVFDGSPSDLTEEVLTTIYGEEDWNAMRQGEQEQNELPRRTRATAWPRWPDERARRYPTRWRRPPQIVTDRRWRIALQMGIVVYLVLAVGSVEVNWARFYDGLERGQRFIMGFLQPDFTSRWRDISQGLVESLTMTLTSTVVGVAISIPIGIGAARNIAPRVIYFICRVDHRRQPCAAGGDHRHLLRGDVRLRPLRGVPDADLRHDRLHRQAAGRRHRGDRRDPGRGRALDGRVVVAADQLRCAAAGHAAPDRPVALSSRHQFPRKRGDRDRGRGRDRCDAQHRHRPLRI